MNEQLGMRNADREHMPAGTGWEACCKQPKGRDELERARQLRIEKHGMSAGSATPPYPVGMPRRGVRGLLNVAWASSPCMKLAFLLMFCGGASIALAQDDVPPPPPVEMLPPESYSFAMKLPDGTNCSAIIKPVKSDNQNKRDAKNDPSTASGQNSMKVERVFRKGIASSTEVRPDGAKETYYFVGGMCAYDNPTEGVNVLRFLSGHPASNVGSYHFPELAWAIPDTHQVEGRVVNGKQLNVFKVPDENLILEVDAGSGRPVRFTDGQMEWTYSYEQSLSPIVLPDTLKKALPPQNNE